MIEFVKVIQPANMVYGMNDHIFERKNANKHPEVSEQTSAKHPHIVAGYEVTRAREMERISNTHMVQVRCWLTKVSNYVRYICQMFTLTCAFYNADAIYGVSYLHMLILMY